MFLRLFKLDDEIRLKTGNRRFRLPVSYKAYRFNVEKYSICYKEFEAMV